MRSPNRLGYSPGALEDLTLGSVNSPLHPPYRAGFCVTGGGGYLRSGASYACQVWPRRGPEQNKKPGISENRVLPAGFSSQSFLANLGGRIGRWPWASRVRTRMYPKMMKIAWT